ncbi:unnamed protein product [Cuscuta campestris]|uniref:K Homology domain-containing protein n=1 Tax=Cuscuta campestris TaxID=132261 RepID=A0A484KIZ5_9ASTE|nr:unnamed protein product [Cuscuta campestris]
MGAPQPWPNGSVKNHRELSHRRTKSEGTLFLEIHPGHRHLFQALPLEKRKLLGKLNLDDTQGLPTKKRKIIRGLNGITQSPSSIGETNDLKPRWTVFRLLIPTMDDEANHYNRYLKPNFDRKDVEVDFHSAAGVGVVMVSAKRDSILCRRSINHAVNVFKEVHRCFLRTIPLECLTRLLVPAAHAKSLIILNTIKSCPWRLTIYLTDNMPVFFPGDVIVDVEVNFPLPGDVLNHMESVVSDLGELAIDDCMKSKFKSGKNIRPSYREISAPGKSSSKVKPRREYAIWQFRRIPLSYIDHIIGEDGANLEKIWKSSPASVYLETATAKEVVISILGESYKEIKAAKEVMEELIPDDKKIDEEGGRVFEGMFEVEGGCTSYGDAESPTI